MGRRLHRGDAGPPGQETIPYHLGWAAFALAYGLATWQRWQLVLALAGYTIASGVVLARSAVVGNVEWQETSEIPLMFALALLMVWHVHRRQEALSQATVLAERDIQAAQDRERLMRLTSHELRTPLTIARGYVELLQERASELEDQQDLAVAADELDRLSRVSDRLVRMIRLQDDTVTEDVDLDRVLTQAVERWRTVADRTWLLRTRLGHCLGSAERLRTCLDTLIENALRYTGPGDTIRLVGVRREAEPSSRCSTRVPVSPTARSWRSTRVSSPCRPRPRWGRSTASPAPVWGSASSARSRTPAAGRSTPRGRRKVEPRCRSLSR